LARTNSFIWLTEATSHTVISGSGCHFASTILSIHQQSEYRSKSRPLFREAARQKRLRRIYGSEVDQHPGPAPAVVSDTICAAALASWAARMGSVGSRRR
jgi:hypothetical protein